MKVILNRVSPHKGRTPDSRRDCVLSLFSHKFFKSSPRPDPPDPPSDVRYCISEAGDLNSSKGKGWSVCVYLSKRSVVLGWSHFTRHFVALEVCNKWNTKLLRNKKIKQRPRVNYDYITVFWDVMPCNLLRTNVLE